MKAITELPRSLVVMVSKHALVAATALLCIAVVATAMFNQRSGGARLVLNGSDAVVTEKPVMQHPRYRGLDSKNRPFLITAETGHDEGDKTYSLQMVRASFAAGTKDAMDITCANALYASANEQVDLNGNVLLSTARGYQFETEAITLYTRSQTAKGNVEIKGQGPAGTLKADRFEILDGGQKITFAGRVHVTLTPKPR